MKTTASGTTLGNITTLADPSVLYVLLEERKIMMIDLSLQEILEFAELEEKLLEVAMKKLDWFSEAKVIEKKI